jgi:hypothetical protein
MKALLPSDEAERLEALAGYKILDTAAERNFDDITLLASSVWWTRTGSGLNPKSA